MLILINRRSTPSTCPPHHSQTLKLSASMSLSPCLPVCLTDGCNLIKEACGGSQGFAPAAPLPSPSPLTHPPRSHTRTLSV